MRFLLSLILATAVFAADATLEIVKEVGSNLNIAVESTNPKQTTINKKIEKIIEADLMVASFYNVVKSPSKDSSLAISNPVYRNSNLDQLVRYEQFNEAGKIGIRVKVYDIKKQKEILNRSYTVSKEDRYVFLAHHFVMELAKVQGYNDLEWMGKFVLISKHVGKKETEILIADYTLTFQQPVVRGGFSVFPKWADENQRAFYYTQYHAKPTLYRVDLYTGEKKRIIESDGMLACSDVSKDGKRLLLTMAPNEQPDIYELDLTTNKLRQFTKYSGIDVNGHYLEGDNAYLFVSDRLGYPEIFYGSLSNPQNAVQFVFKGRNNNYINTWKHYAVFVSRDTDSEFAENTFNLYLISTKSDFIRQLTTTGKNNFPRFSKSGETILHTKEFKRESALGIIRLGYNKSFLFPLEKGQIQAIDW